VGNRSTLAWGVLSVAGAAVAVEIARKLPIPGPDVIARLSKRIKEKNRCPFISGLPLLEMSLALN
jgi:hypothetical protein